MCFCARSPADQAGAVPWQRCGTALPRAARRNKLRAAAHGDCCLLQPCTRTPKLRSARGGQLHAAGCATARGTWGLRRTRAHAFLFISTGRQWSLCSATAERQLLLNTPGSGPSRPPCAGSSTAFGLSSLLQRAAQVSVSLHAAPRGRRLAITTKGDTGAMTRNKPHLRYRKNGSAANSTSPPKS